MPLWGTEDTLEGKPKIHGRSLLADPQVPGVVDPRTGIYATTAGWVKAGVGRTGKTLMPEVLVAIRGLSIRSSATEGFGGTAMAQANITSFNWNISTWSVAAGGTTAAGTALSVTANFNEAVVVGGTSAAMYLQVDNGNQGASSGRGPHNLLYVSGSGTNRLTFDLEYGAANAAIAVGDILTIADDVITHAGSPASTIVDAVGAGNSVITNVAGMGVTAGSITAVT
jgi:hypothetical protein